MRIFHIALVAAAMGVAMPTDAPPPNTVLLSEMMRELSAKPGFTEGFLNQIQGGSKKKAGAALLTPDLIEELRRLIVGKDWQGLDRFPGWTMDEITPTVGALSKVTAKEGSPQYKDQKPIYLDVGPYSFDGNGIAMDFRKPSPLPGFSLAANVSVLGDGVSRGDGPSELARQHAESQRLADVLNRLAANGLDGVPFANAFWNDERTPSTPEELIAGIAATGQTVTVTDSRYFANFGHLHYKGQDVMMPFFINSRMMVPGTDRPLLVPASHAEYEWHIRGRLLNADVSFYFGIDGKAEFRTMDSLDQAWVMKRDAHTYTGAEAIEVTRLSGAMVRTYMRLHQAHPAMPFGGYYGFGVCQDVVAAIELKMTGKATLFPNTADASFFTDPRDAEVNDLIRRLPKDRDGSPPAPERIFGSLPVGDSDEELAQVSIPGLGADLVAVHDAWLAGTLKRTPSPLRRRLGIAAIGLVAFGVVWWLLGRRKRRQVV